MTAFAVMETARAIAYGPWQGNVLVTARGLRIVKRVRQEVRP
nr:hypothetical protein [Streptomyces sp. CHD11]